MNKKVKLVFKYLGLFIAFLLLCVICYLLYIILSYSRIKDNLSLDISQNSSIEEVLIDNELSITSYNIGFGAYSQNYSFFLDTAQTLEGNPTSGYYGTALSKEEVLTNTNDAINVIKELNPDFALFQEVDIKSTRSYKVNQLELITNNFKSSDYTFGINFNSAFLPYPLYDMHGKSLAGIATISKYQIQNATRVSLPIATDLSKLFDLDRCFVINEYKTSNDNKLIIVNIHMSAYDEGGVIRKQQLDLLNSYLDTWYKEGYYVIVAGDFNHDLISNNPLYNYDLNDNKAFNEFISHKKPDWLQLFFDENKKTDINENYKVYGAVNSPTNRDASVEWQIGSGYVATIDGFIVSNNIEVISVETIVTQNGNKGLDHFAFSDHDPTIMKFKLK